MKVIHSELQLIQALKNGDERAMTEIYNLYWRKLLAISYNHTKDKFAAQEIVQNVLIKLWDRRFEINIDSLPNYLATAIKYSVINYNLREKRRRDIEFANCSVIDFDFDDEKIYTQFLQKYISGVVDQLPEKCKLVFKYSRENGKTSREIASNLGISQKTVEAHLTKAIKTIKLALRDGALVFLLIMILFFYSQCTNIPSIYL